MNKTKHDEKLYSTNKEVTVDYCSHALAYIIVKKKPNLSTFCRKKKLILFSAFDIERLQIQYQKHNIDVIN